MKLEKTLRVLRRVSSVFDSGPGIDDALLVSDIDLVLRILKHEIARLPDDQIEPRLLVALSKLYLAIGDEARSLEMFQRAALFTDQNRGYFTDLGSCAVLLCRENASAEFAQAIANATDGLLVVCPFPEDLLRALGRTS